MRLTSAILIVSLVCLSAAAEATGSKPNAELGDGINVDDVALQPSAHRGQLRVLFTVENSSSRAVRFNRLRVAGHDFVITVGGRPLDPAGPGLLLRYDETLDFTTSHLTATAPADWAPPEDPGHVTVELAVDGTSLPIEVHRSGW